MQKHINNVNQKHLGLIVALIVVALVGAYALMSSRAMKGENGMYSVSVVGVNIANDSKDMPTKRTTISVKLQNLDNELLQVSPGLQMFVKTNTGNVYNMTAQYLPKDASIGGPLESNQTMQLAVDYDIPTAETAQTFIFQPNSSTPETEIGL